MKNKKNKISSFYNIIESSIKLFSKKWYSSVSIAEICRKTKISNGLFYHYFSNKDELIKTILDKTVEEINNLLSDIKGNDIGQKIYNIIDSMLNYTNKNKDLILVFREGQYRYIEYERKLVQIYKNTLKKILNTEISLSLYLFVFGGIRFCSIRNALYGINISIDALKDIVLNGIFHKMNFESTKIFAPIKLLNYNYALKTKDKIIEAGKTLFGQNSYDEVNIHNIMESAGFASGTFYKHFKSKEAFFEMLVEISGKQIRHFITENLSNDLNRIERELRGIFLFLNYLNFDRNCYNIVRESEFVNKKKVVEYYNSFVNGYKKVGTIGIDNEKILNIPYYYDTTIEFLLGISHYFGIEYIFNKQDISLDKVIIEIGKLLKEGIGGMLK